MATMQQAVVGFSWDTASICRERDRTDSVRLQSKASSDRDALEITDEDTRVLLGGISSGSFYALKNRSTKHWMKIS